METLREITDLKNLIENTYIVAMGKRSQNATRLLHALFNYPVMTVKDVASHTGLSAKAANALVQVFLKKNILTEITGHRRNRIFVFGQYLNLFED